MTEDEGYEYENTLHSNCYPDGCECSYHRTEGRLDTQADETCTATRWTDSYA